MSCKGLGESPRRDPGRQSRHYVFLLTAAGTTFYVGVAQYGREPAWRVVWRQRRRLNTPLARHLRSLAEPPIESVLVGGTIALDAKTADAVVDLVKGWFAGSVSESKLIGRKPRPVAREEGDGLRLWPSRNQAARALGLSRQAVRKRVRGGELIDAADWEP